MTSSSCLRRRCSRLAACLALVLLGLSLAGATVQADSYDDRRMRTAARLVRALLTAHEGLDAKLQADGVVEVLVLGQEDRPNESLLRLIAPPVRGEPSRVSGHALRVRASADLPAQDAPQPVAVFLSARVDEQTFSGLLQWCIERGVILYSPFEGDVERGATAGVSIQAKVQPLVNRETLRASGIALRRFYLDHSKVVP